MCRAMPGWRYSWRYRKTISAELFASNYPGVSQWAIGPLDVGRASRPADQRLLKGDRARPECRRGLKSLTEAAIVFMSVQHQKPVGLDFHNR